jgi:hypothetical protein
MRACVHECMRACVRQLSTLNRAQIDRANNLIATDTSGLSDPYLTLEWGGQRFSTRVRKQTLNPTFNETIYFHVSSAATRAFVAAENAARRFGARRRCPRVRT